MATVLRTNETKGDRENVVKVGDNVTAALLRMKRASDRLTGCYLTPGMIDALSSSVIAEWWDEAAHDKNGK